LDFLKFYIFLDFLKFYIFFGFFKVILYGIWVLSKNAKTFKNEKPEKKKNLKKRNYF